MYTYAHMRGLHLMPCLVSYHPVLLPPLSLMLVIGLVLPLVPRFLVIVV